MKISDTHDLMFKKSESKSIQRRMDSVYEKKASKNILSWK